METGSSLTCSLQLVIGPYSYPVVPSPHPRILFLYDPFNYHLPPMPRVHNKKPLVLILSQLNPVDTFPPYFLRPILMLHSHLRLSLYSALLSSVFPTEVLYAFTLFSCVLGALPISSSLN